MCLWTILKARGSERRGEAADFRPGFNPAGPGEYCRGRMSEAFTDTVRRWKVIGSLRVTLGAEPRDLAFAIHPVVDVRLASEAGDFSGCGAFVLCDNHPVIFGVTNRFECHFCFCHAALSRHLSQKRIPRCHGETASIWPSARTPMNDQQRDRRGLSSRTRITAPSRSAARIRSWASACSRWVVL